MGYDREWQLIETWVANGKLTRDAILQTLSNDIIDNKNWVFKEEELATLRENFEAIATPESGTLLLSEDAFVAFLRNTGAISDSNPEAARIIYRSIVYLSSFPFGAETPSKSITFEDLVRGIAWMRPDRAEKLTISSNFTRSRSPADHRRVLFQSLATSSIDNKSLPSDDYEHARKEAERRAFDFPDEGESFSLADFAAVNYDEDGDEMYHDVLDVLHSTHPLRDNPPTAPIHREAFRPLAKQLHDGEIKLHQMSIPHARFKILIKSLLAYRCGGANNTTQTNTDDYDNSAENITQAFTPNPQTNITWPMFDQTYTKLAPYLFQAFHDLISSTFLGSAPNPPKNSNPPSSEKFTTTNGILTPPILRQLATIFSETITLEDMDLVRRLHPQQTTPPSSAEDFFSIPSDGIEEDSEGFVIVVSGRSSVDDEIYTFGCYTYQPWNDGASIQAREYAHWECCSLFQISPVHGFFRGKVGRRGWVVSGGSGGGRGGIHFGQSDQGVGMELKDGLRRAVFTHKVSGSKDTATFEALDWRGDFAVEMEVHAIEIWRN